MKQRMSEDKKELTELCETVKRLAQKRDYNECEKLIFQAMGRFPHAPEPHNLIGVLLKQRGDHVAAMKHLRAAWALDPTYIPARHNLDSFASFMEGDCVFDENDLP